MPSLRSQEAELLDLPGVAPEDVRQSLADMHRINRLLGGTRALRALLLPELRRTRPQKRLRLLDAGCGGGGMSRWVESRAPSGRRWEVVGVDRERRHLREASSIPGGRAEGDLSSLPFRRGAFDFSFSTLTLHHLEPAALVAALRELGRVTRRTVVLNDLVRSRAAQAAFAMLSPLVARNEVTRRDGAASIRRAYTPAELGAIAQEAGCRDARIVRHRLFHRMTLIYAGSGE